MLRSFSKYLGLCINLVCIIPEAASKFPRKRAGKVSQKCNCLCAEQLSTNQRAPKRYCAFTKQARNCTSHSINDRRTLPIYSVSAELRGVRAKKISSVTAAVTILLITQIALDCLNFAAVKGYPSFLISNILGYLTFFRFMAPRSYLLNLRPSYI